MTKFPTTIPPAGAANTTDTLAQAGHTALHNNDRDEIRALATKLGTGASTPSAGTVLRGTGAGASAFGQVALASEVSGILPVANGGTGVDTLSELKTDLALDNVDNTSDATKKADIIGTIYPVGSIYISTSSSNPNTILGLGTWVAFGEGKVLVGLDSGDTDFDTAEETGGDKVSSHQHENPFGSDSSGAWFIDKSGSSGSRVYNPGTGNRASHTANSTADGNIRVYNTQLADSSTVQPYVVVYMWKRTA